MAKSKKKGGRKTNSLMKIRIPLAIVAGLAPGVVNVWQHRKDDPNSAIAGMGAAASRVFLGYASTNRYGYNDTIGFHPYLLSYGTGPLLMGVAIHWLANKLGVNRALRGIPFVQI